MLVEIKRYNIRCDGCKTLFARSDVYKDVEKLLNDVKAAGWKSLPNSLVPDIYFCPNCYKTNDNHKSV